MVLFRVNGSTDSRHSDSLPMLEERGKREGEGEKQTTPAAHWNRRLSPDEELMFSRSSKGKDQFGLFMLLNSDVNTDIKISLFLSSPCSLS